MCLTQTLHTAHQIMSGVVLDRTGLTHSRALVLAFLAANDGASQTHAVEATGIDRSTLAQIMSSLLKEGYVTRRRSREDARAYVVKLTDKGRTAAAAFDAAQDDIAAAVSMRVAGVAKLSIKPEPRRAA